MTKGKKSGKVPMPDFRAGTPGDAGIRTPPKKGDTILNLAVRIEKRSRKAILDLGTELGLRQDAPGQNLKDFAQPVERFGLFDCQTCTLIMRSAGVKATAKGAKVKVSVKTSGDQTILVVK